MVASWWDFVNRGGSTILPIPDLDRRGHFDIHYTRWCFERSSLFHQKAQALRKVEKQWLVRADLPPIDLDVGLLRGRFSLISQEIKRITSLWLGDSVESPRVGEGQVRPPRPLWASQAASFYFEGCSSGFFPDPSMVGPNVT